MKAISEYVALSTYQKVGMKLESSDILRVFSFLLTERNFKNENTYYPGVGHFHREIDYKRIKIPKLKRRKKDLNYNITELFRYSKKQAKKFNESVIYQLKGKYSWQLKLRS
jgi:hypothetical protein